MKKTLVQLSAYLLGIFLLLYSCTKATEPDIGYVETAEEAPIDGLPNDATEINYYLRGAFGPFTTYSFKTSEESFRAWVGKQKELHPRVGEIKLGESSITYIDSKAQQLDQKSIMTALESSWYFEDESLRYVYDLETHTAYYYMSTR